MLNWKCREIIYSFSMTISKGHIFLSFLRTSYCYQPPFYIVLCRVYRWRRVPRKSQIQTLPSKTAVGRPTYLLSCIFLEVDCILDVRLLYFPWMACCSPFIWFIQKLIHRQNVFCIAKFYYSVVYPSIHISSFPRFVPNKGARCSTCNCANLH